MLTKVAHAIVRDPSVHKRLRTGLKRSPPSEQVLQYCRQISGCNEVTLSFDQLRFCVGSGKWEVKVK
jgi:hypothetical protein